MLSLASSWYINLQAKSYAHVRRQADGNDRGYVSISYGLFVTRLHVEDKKACYCRVALFYAFGFLNILMPIALAKSLSWYYPRVRAVASGRHFTACLYWAAALIAFLFNVIYTGMSLVQHYHNEPANTSCIVELSKCKCSIPSDINEVLTFVAKVTIIPIAVFVELVISFLTVRHHISGKRYNSRYHLRKHFLLQAVHVIALWNINSDTPTTIHNVCYSPLHTTVDPPTRLSNVSLLGIVDNGTGWLDSYCCLPDVSVSESEEKSLLQCKTLWKYICTLHCDNFNRGTYFQPVMGL